jgi:hypothetical protein
MAIIHHTQTAKANDPTKDVSATAWNESHDGHDLALHTTLGLTTAGLPVGSIIIWGGTIASVPAHYMFCDGTSLVIADNVDLSATL